MEAKFGVCVGCEVGENADCPLFVETRTVLCSSVV